MDALWYIIGKGRGRQVIAVARTADVVIMMLDATKGDVQRCVMPSLCVLTSLGGLRGKSIFIN